MYLVMDDYGDYKELKTYKELRFLLIDELSRDIKENIKDEDIVKNCLATLVDIAKKENYDVKYFKEQLQSYGWYTLDVFHVQQDVNNLREFYARTHTSTQAFDDVLKILDEDFRK
jgi:hypothetical protein